MTGGTWLIVCSAAVMLLATFMPWFTATIDPRFAPLPDKAIIAWESTSFLMGVFVPVVLTLAVCVIVLVADLGAPATRQRMARGVRATPWLAGLALLIFLVPLWTGVDSKLQAIGPSDDGSGYIIHRGIGLYLAVLTATGVLIGSLVRVFSEPHNLGAHE